MEEPVVNTEHNKRSVVLPPERPQARKPAPKRPHSKPAQPGITKPVAQSVSKENENQVYVQELDPLFESKSDEKKGPTKPAPVRPGAPSRPAAPSRSSAPNRPSAPSRPSTPSRPQRPTTDRPAPTRPVVNENMVSIF